MRGQRALLHPDIEDINHMFDNGYTAMQVSLKLWEMHRNPNLWLTEKMLKDYKRNFLEEKEIVPFEPVNRLEKVY